MRTRAALLAAALLLASTPMASATKVYRHVVIKPLWTTDSACGRFTTTANLEINNYPVRGGQIYDLDMDGDTGTAPDMNTYAIYVDGVKQSGTQTFWIRFNDTRTHTIKGKWRYGVCFPYNSITL